MHNDPLGNPDDLVTNFDDWRHRRLNPTSYDLKGMIIVPVLYENREKNLMTAPDSTVIDSLRYQSRRREKDFVRWLANNFPNQLKADLALRDSDLETMRKDGTPPDDYNVHHRMPLGGCRQSAIADRVNDFDNFVLIRRNVEHKAIHRYLDAQIENLPRNGRKIINLPVPMGYWFKPNLFNQIPEQPSDSIYHQYVHDQIKQQTSLGLAIHAAKFFINHPEPSQQSPESDKLAVVRYLEPTYQILYTAKNKKSDLPPAQKMKQLPRRNIPEPTDPVIKFVKKLAAQHGPELEQAFRLNHRQIQDMRQHGKLPPNLKIHYKVPIRDCGDNEIVKLATQPENFVLTTAWLKQELDRQYRKQVRNKKPGESALIIVTVFAKPWFSNKPDDLPDHQPTSNALSILKNRADDYQKTHDTIDIAAQYDQLYAPPQPLPESTTGQKIKKKRKENCYINGKYVAILIKTKTTQQIEQEKAIMKRKNKPEKQKIKKEQNNQTKTESNNEQNFVKWIGTTFSDQIKKDLNFNDQDIENMQKDGKLPKQYMIGYRIPLKGSGDPFVLSKQDHFDNMVIIRTEHQSRLNKAIKSQTSGMNPGEKRVIDLPVIPGYWAKPMTQEEIALHQKDILTGFETMMEEQQSALHIARTQAEYHLALRQMAQQKPILTTNTAPTP